ncbi:hypothetical protein JXA56_03455 [Candidatus Micrarchaeota archaeon]|nr:hypothetical protein [Candidatus Micrarchaeota archaeon]
MAFFDKIVKPFIEWSNYVSKNHIRYYVGLLKILLFSAVAGLIIAAIINLISSAAGGIEEIGIIAGSVILLLGMAIIYWIQKAISLTTVLYTDAEFSKRKFSIMEAFGKIKWPVLRYIILECVILLVLLIPAIIMFSVGIMNLLNLMVQTNGGIDDIEGMVQTITGTVALYLAGIAYAFVIVIGYNYLVQFWIYGFLLQGKGVVNSLKESVGIVRNNIFLVFAFDLVWLAIAMIFAIPFIIYNYVFGLAISAAVFAAFFAYGSLGMIIAAAISMGTSLIFTTIISWFTVPTHYLFWKKRTEIPVTQKTGPVPAKAEEAAPKAEMPEPKKAPAKRKPAARRQAKKK